MVRWLGVLGARYRLRLFVDELGKFITSNNDYFFEPTVGLLYLLFVLLFRVFQLLDRPEKRNRQPSAWPTSVTPYRTC